MRRQIAWKALAWAAAGAAAWAGRKATTAVWSRFTEGDPTRPGNRETTWAEAVTWAVVAGAIATTARMLARRGATEAWEAMTGEAPPGI